MHKQSKTSLKTHNKFTPASNGIVSGECTDKIAQQITPGITASYVQRKGSETEENIQRKELNPFIQKKEIAADTTASENLSKRKGNDRRLIK